jgi:hypothetical protein
VSVPLLNIWAHANYAEQDGRGCLSELTRRKTGVVFMHFVYKADCFRYEF